MTKTKEDVESIVMPKFIKSESTAEVYLNGEIQGGAKACIDSSRNRVAKGVHDICLKAVAVVSDDVLDTYYALAQTVGCNK